MKRLILLALALTSCAPLLRAAQHEQGSLERTATGLTLINPGPDAMTGDPSKASDGPAVLVEGQGLVIDSPNCKPRESGRWGCILPNVPAGRQQAINVAAGRVTWASATFYRQSKGVVPVYLELNGSELSWR